MTMPASLRPAPVIEYPDCDGEPMSDNTRQFQWIVTIKEGLDLLFADRPDVFVAGDLLWYPVEGHPEIRAAPDAMVAFGRPKGHRGSYMQWLEDNVAPQVAWEVLSPSNYPAPLKAKLEFYERYGIEEYYQYDPDKIRLRGWLREEDLLVEITDIDGWVSPRTGVRLELGQGELVLLRPDGERFLSYPELAISRQEEKEAKLEAQRRASQQQQRADQAIQQAEQEHQRAEQEHQRAEQERQRAEQERQRAEQKQLEAAAAQEQTQRLAARLRELGIDPEV